MHFFGPIYEGVCRTGVHHCFRRRARALTDRILPHGYEITRGLDDRLTETSLVRDWCWVQLTMVRDSLFASLMAASDWPLLHSSAHPLA